MTTLHSFRAAVAAALLLALAGCGRRDDLSPPRIVYGQAECELCRMIISEEPFAAAAVIVATDGVRKVAFDDVGCLIEYVRGAAGSGRVIGYVHDYESRAWIDAAEAVFVYSEALQSPMASNLAAARSESAATELLRRFPGVVVAFDELLAGAAPSRLAADSSPTERSAP